MRITKRAVIFVTIGGAALLLLGLISANLWIARHTASAIATSPDEVPNGSHVLLLGCPTHLSNGRPNLFYQRRLEAAIALQRHGKVKRLIASDHHPEFFQRDLIAKDFPESLIQLDPQGISTLESIRSYAELYPGSNTPLVIISQPDHLARALYMAQHFGVPATGYAAQDVAIPHSFKTKIREALARVKALVNLHLVQVPLERTTSQKPH